MQPGRKTVIQEYQQEVKELNDRMSKRGYELFQTEFLDKPFSGTLSGYWVSRGQKAMQHLAPKTLQVSFDFYYKVLMIPACPKTVILTNEQFALLSNAQENAGPYILDMCAGDDEYKEHLETSEALIAIYQQDLQKARQAIDEQIKQEFLIEHKELEAKYKSSQN